MEMYYLDFEFNNTQEEFVNPVCLSIMDSETETVSNFWLNQDWDNASGAKNRQVLKEWLDSLSSDTVFCSFSAEAEASAFLALGVDPTRFKWLDLHLEWKQLLNHCHKFMYGRIYNFSKSGKYIKLNTKPVEYENGKKVSDEEYEDKETGSHAVCGSSLVSCVYKLFGDTIDSQHKHDTVQLVLRGGPFTDEEKSQIIAYCASDLKYLPRIHQTIKQEQMELGRIDESAFYTHAFVKGRWACDLAKIKSNGIPLNMERVQRISENHQVISNLLVTDLVTNHYPFYTWDKKKNGWVETYVNFKKYIEDNGLSEYWPVSDKSKQYKKDKDTLEDNEHLEEILAYRRTKESLGQLRSLSPGLIDGFMSHVGSDHRQRAYFGPYGTQSSRNAAKATTFTLALSSWLRSIIQPPPGRAITSCDFANQEFLIAALLSKDKAMEEAYDTGDPYMAFAIMSGMAPAGATKKSHPEIRVIAKSLVLGLQYGLGVKKLSVKLTRDSGKPVSVDQAKEYVQMHKETFEIYWGWYTDIVGWDRWIGGEKVHEHGSYSEDEYLRTSDGWFMYGDNQNPRSAGNFPVQAEGAVVLREAVKRLHDAGWKVMAPLHDAVYVEHDADKEKEAQTEIARHMNDAFTHIFGRGIRLDIETHHHGEDWIEEKGHKSFYLVLPYMEPDIKFLMET